MNDPQEVAVLGEIVSIFDKLQIAYAIGGSMASSAYGAARFTQDADISVEPFQDKTDAFFTAVKGTFYISKEAMQEAIHLRRSFNIIHFETAFKIDLFVCRDTSFDRQVLLRRKSLELSHLQGARFSFVSPEDIVLLKLQWYREGGEISDRQWTDILGVLTIQADALDKTYLENSAKALQLGDLLERALKEAQT